MRSKVWSNCTWRAPPLARTSANGCALPRYCAAVRTIAPNCRNSFDRGRTRGGRVGLQQVMQQRPIAAVRLYRHAGVQPGVVVQIEKAGVLRRVDDGLRLRGSNSCGSSMREIGATLAWLLQQRRQAVPLGELRQITARRRSARSRPQLRSRPRTLPRSSAPDAAAEIAAPPSTARRTHRGRRGRSRPSGKSPSSTTSGSIHQPPNFASSA